MGAVANIEPTLDYPGQGNRRENPTKTHLDRMLLSKTNKICGTKIARISNKGFPNFLECYFTSSYFYDVIKILEYVSGVSAANLKFKTDFFTHRN